MEKEIIIRFLNYLIERNDDRPLSKSGCVHCAIRNEDLRGLYQLIDCLLNNKQKADFLLRFGEKTNRKDTLTKSHLPRDWSLDLHERYGFFNLFSDVDGCVTFEKFEEIICSL